MQLIQTPDEQFINKIICLFGFKSYTDKSTHILRSQLQLINIKLQIINVLDELNIYFKRNIKKTDITINKCITIARNLLYTKQLDILRSSKNIKGVKHIYYKIDIKNIRKIKQTQYQPKVISFYDW